MILSRLDWGFCISSRFNWPARGGIWWVILATGTIHRTQCFCHSILVAWRSVIVSLFRSSRFWWSSRPWRHWWPFTGGWSTGLRLCWLCWLHSSCCRHSVQKSLGRRNSRIYFDRHSQGQHDELRLGCQYAGRISIDRSLLGHFQHCRDSSQFVPLARTTSKYYMSQRTAPPN